MKRETQQSSFSIVTNAPVELNFAMYVAFSFDILPKDSIFSTEQGWTAHHRKISNKKEYDMLVSQWRHWWGELVKFKSSNGLKPPYSKYYSSDGTFEVIDSPLRLRCIEAWPSFFEWWNMPAGGQQGTLYWDRIDEFSHLINKVKESGISTGPLVVDYIYAGLEDILEITPRYVIMSIHKPQNTVYNDTWWLNKIKR